LSIKASQFSIHLIKLNRRQTSTLILIIKNVSNVKADLNAGAPEQPYIHHCSLLLLSFLSARINLLILKVVFRGDLEYLK